MSLREISRPEPGPKPSSSARLYSWKEIAAYFSRSVRTVQHWEQEEELPVHRLPHSKRDTVFALTGELDAWLADRQRTPNEEPAVPPRLEPPAKKDPPWEISGRLLVLASAVALIFIAVAAWSIWRYSRIQWALREAVPELQRLTEAEQFWSAYRLAQRAQKYIPDHPGVMRAMTGATLDYVIHTVPEGAEVYLKDYAAPEADWDLLGVTPMEKVPIKLTHLRFRFVKAGYEEVEGGFDLVFTPEITVPLTQTGAGPPGMVFVPRDGWGSSSLQQIDDYWIDRYEVTNRRYQEFVDAGGYRQRKYWKHPFIRGAREIGWDDAMKVFVDKSGRPGPATWSFGTYPEGEEDYPVRGVSWYEAAAYAEFVEKSLPTNAHWQKAAGLGLYSGILSFSNLTGEGPWEVGTGFGIGPYGTYDMAGNVREWCWNQAGDRRYIRGGAWNEPVFVFRQTDAQPPIDRLETYGVRCVRYASPSDPRLLGPTDRPSPRVEPGAEQPIDDAGFELLRSSYVYDRTELHALTEEVDDSHPFWRMEAVSFDAAYPGERIGAIVLLPRHAQPPYQVVLIPPSGGSDIWPSSRDWVLRATVELWRFMVQTGRAAMFPVWKGSLERRLDLSHRESADPTPSERRDLVIAQAKDLSRSIDYLETRQDIDSAKIGYFGFSETSFKWAIFGGIEKRIGAAALWVGGMNRTLEPPEVEAANFAPRATAPALLLNGKLDFMLPPEVSDRLFRLLGTPEEDKIVHYYEGGHIPIDRDELVNLTLDFFDRYLGPVRPATP